MENKVRKISCNEQLYLDMQDIMNTFAIQFILEYTGNVDKKVLEDAINYVLKNTNDNNLKLRGKEWLRNKNDIQVQELEIKTKILTEDEIFKNKIDYKSHSLEVYILKHLEKKYIVFKILHSTCDGKGALSFINNVFRRLRNEELIECNNKVNEQQLANNICVHNKNINFIPRYKFSKKISNVKEYNPIWNIIYTKGYHSGIIAKIAYVLSKEFKNKEVSFMIPVDIRRHLENDNYLGNMTLPIFLNVNQDDSWQDINGKMLYLLKNKEELNKKSLQYIGYQNLPYSIRKIILKSLKKYLNVVKKFTMGAIISYLGKIDINQYTNDKFKIIDFISLPIQQPGAPFSMVISEVNNKTNIVISAYEEQMERNEFNIISNKIKEALEYEIYENINPKTKKMIDDCLEIICSQIQMKNQEIAIDDYYKKYTYRDMDNMSNYIISILNKRNIKKNDTIIIYMKRSFEFICTVLACMKMNIVFIPVDELTNKNRILDIIEDSKCKAIILNELDIESNIEKIRVNYKNYNSKLNYKNEIIKHNDNDILYKIYTSGTTGKPKGIEISYKNISNYLTWAKEIFITEKKLIMPLFTSLSVDLTITSIFLPLLCGGIIKIYKEQFSAFTLEKILKDNEISILKLTPSHLSLINNKNNSSIEKIIVAGENFSSKLAENLYNYFNNNVTIYNEYGPTETTVGCTYEIFKPNEFVNVPIGKCINNTKAYLVNDNEIITTENTQGEIMISGEGVSQGLINSESETIVKIKGELFYKTGDIGFIKNSVLHCIRKKK